MSKVRRVLFIDDDDIDTTIDLLEINLQDKGFELIPTVLDLRDNKFKEEKSGEELLSFELIKGELKQYFDTRFDLIACDFDFKQENLNGFDVVNWLKNYADSQKKSLRRSKFALYSSEIEKYGVAFGNKKNDDVCKLVRLGLIGFLKRELIHEEFVTHFLKEDETLDLSDFIRDELRKFPELVFQNTYERFKGKSFEYIANEIDLGSVHGIGFQKNIVELAVAHLVEMNQSKK